MTEIQQKYSVRCTAVAYYLCAIACYWHVALYAPVDEAVVIFAEVTVAHLFVLLAVSLLTR